MESFERRVRNLGAWQGAAYHGEPSWRSRCSGGISRRSTPTRTPRPTQPDNESPAAAYAVKLKSDEPARRHRIEHLSHPLRLGFSDYRDRLVDFPLTSHRLIDIRSSEKDRHEAISHPM